MPMPLPPLLHKKCRSTNPDTKSGNLDKENALRPATPTGSTKIRATKNYAKPWLVNAAIEPSDGSSTYILKKSKSSRNDDILDFDDDKTPAFRPGRNPLSASGKIKAIP